MLVVLAKKILISIFNDDGSAKPSDFYLEVILDYPRLGLNNDSNKAIITITTDIDEDNMLDKHYSKYWIKGKLDSLNAGFCYGSVSR